MPSNVPSFPKKLPITLLVTLATFVLSGGLVASGELFAGRVPPARPARAPGVPAAAAALPETAGREGGADAEEAPAESAAASLSELVGTHGPGLVAVAPATDAVDAHPILVKLARDLAAKGRAVLIDLDPRQVGASPIADPDAPGVVDLVRGTVSFGQVIHRDRVSSLHIVPLGGPAEEGEDVLDADRLTVALSALVQTYDFVVLASPPATALAKANLAAQLPLVVVVGPKEWEPAEAEALYDRLAAAGIADLIAVIEQDAPAEPVASDDPVMAA
jgi:Mrp family chromosome partitioning ATPase